MIIFIRKSLPADSVVLGQQLLAAASSLAEIFMQGWPLSVAFDIIGESIIATGSTRDGTVRAPARGMLTVFTWRETEGQLCCLAATQRNVAAAAAAAVGCDGGIAEVTSLASDAVISGHG